MSEIWVAQIFFTAYFITLVFAVNSYITYKRTGDLAKLRLAMMLTAGVTCSAVTAILQTLFRIRHGQ